MQALTEKSNPIAGYIAPISLLAKSVSPARKQVCSFGSASRLAPSALLSRRCTPAPSQGAAPSAPSASAAASASAAPKDTKLACGSGVSALPDTAEAATAAVAAARADLPPGASATLAIVSATSDRGGDAVVTALKEALGDVPFVGATSSGAVLTPDGPLMGGISVMLLCSEGSFATASCEYGVGVLESSTKAAEELLASVGGKTVKAVYMAASPGNEEQVMSGIQSVFGADVPVVGGSAADNDLSGSWCIFHNGAVFGTGVAMFAIAGDNVKVGACLSSPYTPTEKSMTVTGADGRTLLTLDDKPAADMLFDAVGDAIEAEYEDGGMILGPMSTRPFALKRGDDHLAVHVAGIEQPIGSVNLFAEAAVGDKLVKMDNAGGGDSAKAAGIAIEESFKGAMEAGGLSDPSAALLIYCGGLGIAVGDKLVGNLTDNFAGLPLPKAALGVNAFGEQGPCGSANQHRNLSVGMLLLE